MKKNLENLKQFQKIQNNSKHSEKMQKVRKTNHENLENPKQVLDSQNKIQKVIILQTLCKRQIMVMTKCVDGECHTSTTTLSLIAFLCCLLSSPSLIHTLPTILIYLQLNFIFLLLTYFLDFLGKVRIIILLLKVVLFAFLLHLRDYSLEKGYWISLHYQESVCILIV